MSELQQKEQFEKWIKDYKALIFKILKVYADTQEDRDDLFQEICFQIWKSILSFKGQSAESTWIYKISLNTSIKWIKKENKNRKKAIESDRYIISDLNSIDDRLQWLYKEISKMSDADKSLSLLLLDGLSHKEIGEIIGLTSNNVSVRAHRIKKVLTEKAKKYEY